MPVDMSEFRDLFSAEAREHIEAMNAALLALEQQPDAEEALSDLFRAAHSLKGIAATMGYDDLARLAHALEDRLDALRQGEEALSPELADRLFQGVDALQTLLNDILAGRPSQVDVDYWNRILAQPSPLNQRTTEIAHPEPKPTPGPQSTIYASKLPETIRVHTRHLDALLNIVAELVISRSHLWRIQEIHNLPDLQEALEKHDRLLSDLRDTVLQTRMVPVAHIFNRFPRMVRDLLRERGKEADFIIEGYNIELDRTILERINDPLLHLLRNAVDHGIESPEERERVGKPRRGKIWLRAWRERDSVVIEVADDGRGLDKDKIVQTAIEREIISSVEAKELNEHQILMLICAPGFSTAQEVTNISGRGVGMDVVKREVEALHGNLTIESTLGEGTTFRLRLPLTLAIIQALLVRVGSEVYAIPLSQVEHIIEIHDDRIITTPQWEVTTDEEGKPIPLISLAQLLNGLTNGSVTESQYTIIVGEGRHRVGLNVDELLGREEIVIRPLPPAFGSVPGIAGASILGEGQVILILDVPNLCDTAQPR